MKLFSLMGRLSHGCMILFILLITGCGGGGGTPSGSSITAQPSNTSKPISWLDQAMIDYLPVMTQQANGGDLCNSDAFTQFPEDITLFVGRHPWPDPATCNDHWGLSIYRMNWSTQQLTLVNDTITLPVSIANGTSLVTTVTDALDPHMVRFNGELWVAFECSGTGFLSASSCIAPLNETTNQLDISRATLIVQTANDGSNIYTASVPKLFVYSNQLYLYWSSVKQDPNGVFLEIHERGMQLQQEVDGLHRFWGANSGNISVLANDPNLTVEVGTPIGVDNRVFDMYDIKSLNGQILLTAGVGGEQKPGDEDSCRNPVSHNSNCYRVEVFKADSPLGNFNLTKISNSNLPLNGQEYTRFVTLPDSSTALMGQFLYYWGTNSNSARPIIPRGYRFHKVDVSAWKF